MKRQNRVCKWISMLLAITILGSLLPVGMVSARELTPVKANQIPLQLNYDAPASDWESEATPIGNGRLGAMIYGGTSTDRIQLNEETLWSGGPGADQEIYRSINEKTQSENWAILENGRKAIQGWMNEFTENGGTGNYPYTPELSYSDMYVSNMLFGGWVSQAAANNFGYYQTFGDLLIGEAEDLPMRWANPNAASTRGDDPISNLYDGDITTRWVSATNAYPKEFYVQYGAAKSITEYRLVSSNDLPGRDPAVWTLYGSNDGKTWTEVDTRSGETFETRGQERIFSLAAPASFHLYKLSITAVHAAGEGCQLAEFRLGNNASLDNPIYSGNEHAVNPPAAEGSGQGTGEGITSLFDGNPRTKWGQYYPGFPKEISVDYGEQNTIGEYTIMSANDADWRDPKAWVLYGRNGDGEDWVKVDAQSGITFEGRFTAKRFILAEPASYSQYKLSVTEVLKTGEQAIGDGCQMAELILGSQKIMPVYSAGNDNAVSENTDVLANLFDGNVNTKWGVYGKGYPKDIIANYNAPYTIDSYSLTAGNDCPERHPMDWALYGSNDGGATWTEIDRVENNTTFPGFKTAQTFQLDSAVTYSMYKLTVLATQKDRPNPNDVSCQLSELTFHQVEEQDPNEIQNYKRTLDVDQAVASVSYTKGGVEYTREYFASNPGNFIAIRMTASEKGALNKYIAFETPRTAVEFSTSDDTITITGRPDDHVEEEHLEFAGQIKVIPVDGTVKAVGDRILTVEDATELLVYFIADSNYQQCQDDSLDFFSDVDPLQEVETQMALAVAGDYDTQKAAHIADYKELYDRVKLDLGGANPGNVTTDRLLSGYRMGTNTDAQNKYLETLMYQYGRYLMISASRPGTLAANLQGIWCNSMTPDWNSDYHADTNIQMNYSMAEQSNLSECHEPMMNLIKALVPHGQDFVQKFFYAEAEDGTKTPARGWATTVVTNAWSSMMQGGSFGSDVYFSGAAWMCESIWERYEYTQNKEELAENFDTLLGASLFWVDTLVEDERDGTLVSNPSYSPEHGPYSVGSTHDQAAIWSLFTNTLEAAEILGRTDSELEEIRTALGKLDDPLDRIGASGAYLEWKDETTYDLNAPHRHLSHLHALMPGNLVIAGRSERDDAIVEAMKQSIRTRSTSTELSASTGWSKAVRVNYWARLLDSESAYADLRLFLANFIMNNMFCTHDTIANGMANGRYQIDGNYGITAGMTEMLVQSQGDSIDLLPALPEVWADVAVTGLKARGNVEVDIEADGTQVKTAVLRPAVDHDGLKITGAGIGNYTVTDSNGKRVCSKLVSENALTFDAVAGEIYTLTQPEEVSEVTLTLQGEEVTTVDAETLTYTVFAEGMVDLATATILVELEGVTGAEPVVEARNGFQSFFTGFQEADGKLVGEIVIGHLDGVNGEGELLSITVPTPEAIGNVQIRITDAVLSAYLGGTSETFVDAVLDDGFTTKVDYSFCDVNCDGVVNQLDLTRIQRHYGQTSAHEAWYARADVSGDGQIQIDDILLVLNNSLYT